MLTNKMQYCVDLLYSVKTTNCEPNITNGGYFRLCHYAFHLYANFEIKIKLKLPRVFKC